VAFSPDGKLLAVGGWRSVRVLELATGEERARFDELGGDVTALAFDPRGRTLATACGDCTVLLWDLTDSLR